MGGLCHRVPTPAICASVGLMGVARGDSLSFLFSPPMQGVPVEMVSGGTCGTTEAPAGFTWDELTQPWQMKLPSTCASPGHLHPAGSQQAGSLEINRVQGDLPMLGALAGLWVPVLGREQGVGALRLSHLYLGAEEPRVGNILAGMPG